MTVLPGPNQVLGEPKTKKLPSPDQVFAEQKPEADTYTQAITAPDKLAKLNQIIENIPELPGDSESKKRLFKDLMLRGVKGQELSDALLTLQGNHPHQEGGYKYYIDDKGLPKPLRNDERPPQRYEVASIWGTKSDAEDDSPITDLAKTVWNILPASAENVVDLAQTGYEMATNESSDFLNSLKNAANYLKFEKDPKLNKPVLDTHGIDEFSDIVDPKRWDFSPNALWGTALGLAGSVGEMYVGGRRVGGILKAANVATKPAAAIATYAGSYMTNLGDARSEGEAAGLKGRDLAVFSGLVTAPIAAIDAKFDLGGKILSNKLMQEEKNAFIGTIAKNVAERTAEGELTKEALDGLAKATTVGYSQLAKKWASQTATDVLQQGGEEAAQQFMMNAGEQLWDKLTPEEKKKFGKDAFSPESFAEYLREGLSGAIGGAPTAFAYNKVKEGARKEAQSNTAYGIATKGPEAVNSFIQNVANEVQQGKLSKQEADNAVFQVKAYQEYHNQTKDLNLKDDEKRRVFDLTFEKQNLESQIPTEYEKQKLNGIQQADIDVKQTKAKHIQDEINKIILREDVQNKTNVRAKKTEEEVAKDIEKEKELKKEQGVYVTPEFVKNEKRTYEEIPLTEWNNPKFNTRIKKYKLADHLDQTATKSTEGTVQQDYKEKIGGHLIDTFNVTLPDGKTVRFASSMVRKPSEKEIGGFRGNTYEENFTDKNNPLGQKVGVTVKTLKDSGRKVMFVWNADKSSPKYGKHIGMIKESLKGKSNYSEADLEEMADLRMTNMGGGPTIEAHETPKGPITTPADVKFVSPKVVLTQPTRENLRTRYITEQIQKLEHTGNYNPDFENVYQKHFGQKFDRLNPTLYGEETTTKEQPIAGTNEGAVQKDTGEGQTKKVRTGIPRSQRKIKSQKRLDALELTVYSPRAIIMQYFIGNGRMSFKAVKDFYKGSEKEAKNRWNLLSKDGPTFDQLAHDLWEENKDFTPFADVQDYKNELESVIQEFQGPVSMAEDLLKAYTLPEQQTPVEDAVDDMYRKAEKDGTIDEVEAIQDKLEDESDETKAKLAEDQKAFDKWEEDSDIKYFEGDIPFQKESKLKGDVSKIVEKLQKNFPKVKVKYDDSLLVAGFVHKDTIYINPKYVGVDTPIHEYGHILIDAIGYEDKTIQAAIKQLRNTDLYKETKRRYSELNQQQLDKEVLAEAIGREGAGIFDKESEKSKFLQYLDYIFTKLKQLFGLDKNVVRSLAKQIISGIGTSGLIGTEEQQFQKTKEEKINELKDKSIEDLVTQYWEYVNSGVKGKKFDELKKQLGYKLFQTRKQELLNSPNAEKFIEKLANVEDIGKKDILFKTLSHMSENFPELQKFSKEFENANFEMVQEANQLKSEAEKLARAVIEEKNKTLGIKEKVKNLFSSDNAKYFEYLENPKAIEEYDEDTDETTYSPGFWTEEQAKEKGFTPAQIKFLNFMRKLQELRNEQYLESGNTGEIDAVFKVDKGFWESLKTGSLTEAFSAYLGNTAAIHDTELKFNDPVTGKVDLETYGNIEKKLIAYGKKGILSKIKAMGLMLKYNFQARRRSKEKFGQFSISPNGTLNNKFLKSRDKNRGYSKDFYKAALSFIDDYTHTKHLGKLLPYIDSIEAINKSGYLEHAAKPNTVEYIKKWKDLHLFKNDKQGALGPEVDAALRLLRKLTSLSVMAFNVPAAFWNAGTGIYNNIRAEGGKAQGIGLKRLFEGTDRAKFKAYNKKANDIINKYHVVSSDYDSNPKLFAGKIFDMLANGLNREAEYLIQGSMFLGQLSDADYNNLQYNDKGELEYVGNDPKEFKERVIKYKNRVSDIQGKYAEKDRRNYNLTEFGKSAAQFKNWLPDAIKERFGAQYINADGELKNGTWNAMLGEGFQDLKKQINEKGFGKAIWENKEAMANLKGALTVAVLLSFKLGGDDDKKKRSAADTLDKALGNVLMIFDPQTLKFTVSNPIPSIGTLNRFIDAFEHAVEIDGGVKFDFARAGKDIGKAIPYNKAVSQTYDLLNEG